MGGKPSRATPADQRLKRNNPNAGKPKTTATTKTATTPQPASQPKKGQ